VKITFQTLLLTAVVVLFARDICTGQEADQLPRSTDTVRVYKEVQPSVRRALIIAIGDYPSSPLGWGKINAKSDAVLLAATLIHQGFDKNNLLILSDSEATYQGILDAFETFGKSIHSGDHLLVHFSSHGQQIADDNGDEADGYDEALIPWDAGKYYIQGVYEGEKHLRDDVLEVLLENLQKLAGSAGSLLVTLDACHSGTATRGEGIVRGTDKPFSSTPDVILRNERIEKGFGFGTDKNETAPMTVISASASHQNNFEYSLPDGSSIGSLTWAFCRSMMQLTDSSTCQSLFNQIRLTFASVHPCQQPEMEGEQQIELFGSRRNNSNGWIQVNGMVNDTIITIEAGTLQGFTEGSEVGFIISRFQPEISDTIASGVIVRADLLQSEVLVKKGFADTIPPGLLLCHLIRLNCPGIFTRLQLKNENTPLSMRLQGIHEKYPFVHLVDASPEVILTSDGNHAELVTAEGTLLLSQTTGSESENSTVVEMIASRLWMYSRAKFLRQLDATDPDMEVVVELLSNSGNPLVIDPEKGIPVCHTGDTIMVRIANTGNRPLYFNLADLQPDEWVNVLIPGTAAGKKTMNDLRLEPGGSYRSDPFLVEPPAGLEMFKCIATTSPVDLRDAFSPAIIKTSRNLQEHPLSLLFTLQEGSTPDTRSSTAIITGSVHIQPFIFYIEN
jgi:metacaspase-1